MNQIISTNDFTFALPYRLPMRWRVRGVNGGAKGSWSEHSFLLANTNRYQGFVTTIPWSHQDAPTSFAYFFQPTNAASQVRVMVDDNSDFSSPIAVREQGTTGFFKNLPANQTLYLRVEEWNSHTIYYPDSPLCSFTMSFTTGSNNISDRITFLTEKDAAIFDAPSPPMALSKNFVWIEKQGVGYIRVNPIGFDYQLFNRSNTDGLVGVWTGLRSMHSDKNQMIQFMARAPFGATRWIRPVNEDLSGETPVTNFYEQVRDFDPDGKLTWVDNQVFQEKNGNVISHRTFETYEYVVQVKVSAAKVWTLIVNSIDGSSRIVVTDLESAAYLETFSSNTHPELQPSIQQLDAGINGEMWVRQVNNNTFVNSVARYDGTGWTVYDMYNSPFSNNLSALSIGANGNAYILETGGRSRISRFKNLAWEDVQIDLPFESFNGELLIDKYENFWLSTIYGVVRIAGSTLPVTLVSFEAAKEENSVRLSWHVEDEVDMLEYVVEHSSNGKNFLPIGRLNAIQQPNYEFTHSFPAAGKNYYRLKSVETNHDFALSKIVTVTFPGGADPYLYPNPTQNTVNISLKAAQAGMPGKISVFSQDGKKLADKSVPLLKTLESVDLSPLPGGRYFIRIDNGNETISRPIELVK